MSVAVRYQSRGGNTRAAAETLAEALGVKAEPITVPVTEPADVLVLCGGTYAFKPDKEMSAFICSLDAGKAEKAYVLATASGTKHGVNGMTAALQAKGITVADSFLLRLGAQGNTLLGKKGGSLSEAQKTSVREFAAKIRA